MVTTTASVIAVDVGGTTVKAALFTLDGTLVGRASAATFPLDRHGTDHRTAQGGAPLGSVISAIERLRTIAVHHDTQITGIGLCSPGMVDSDRGHVVGAVNLGWLDIPIRDLLESRFDVPVRIEHDARAAGRAEQAARQASGKDSDDFVFIPIGTGISAAMVTSGLAIRGAMNAAGEFGHIIARAEGEPCACGQRGCVEVYASAANILRRYRRGGRRAATTNDIVDRLGSDDVADACWADAVDALTTGLIAVTALLDPTTLVVGGGLSQAGVRLLNPLRSELTKRLTWRTPPAIEQTLAGVDAGVIGAALMAGAQLPALGHRRLAG